MANPLAESFRYNRWANLRLIEACGVLSDEQLEATVPGAFGTVRETLMHLVGGEQTFALRTSGRQHEGELTSRDPWPGPTRLAAIAAAAGDELVAIAEQLETDDDIVLPYMGKRPRFPRSFFLAHALGHSAEHRTQVAMTLAAIGLTTPDLDGWAYAEACGYGHEA